VLLTLQLALEDQGVLERHQRAHLGKHIPRYGV
jgi:hypothetical protein